MAVLKSYSINLINRIKIFNNLLLKCLVLILKCIYMKSPLTTSLRKQTPIHQKAIPYMTTKNKFYKYENHYYFIDVFDVC